MGPAIYSVVGVIVGAGLQYLFARFLEHQKHSREIQAQAYADYLRCASESSTTRSLNEELRTRITDSKCRLCLYGSSSVVNTMAEFERLGSGMALGPQRMSFVKLISAMRRSSLGRQSHVLDASLELTLFGPK